MCAHDAGQWQQRVTATSQSPIPPWWDFPSAPPVLLLSCHVQWGSFSKCVFSSGYFQPVIGFPECNSMVSQEAICGAHDIVRGVLKPPQQSLSLSCYVQETRYITYIFSLGPFQVTMDFLEYGPIVVKRQWCRYWGLILIDQCSAGLKGDAGIHLVNNPRCPHAGGPQGRWSSVQFGSQHTSKRHSDFWGCLVALRLVKKYSKVAWLKISNKKGLRTLSGQNCMCSNWQ